MNCIVCQKIMDEFGYGNYCRIADHYYMMQICDNKIISLYFFIHKIKLIINKNLNYTKIYDENNLIIKTEYIEVLLNHSADDLIKLTNKLYKLRLF